MDFSMEKAKDLLEIGAAEAQELIQDPPKVDEVLVQLENKLQEVPAIGETLSDLPLMISMVKSWISREYSNVSPKVIATMVGAFVYLLKKKDLISDNVPILGIADDLAVLGMALKLCEPELKAFKEFRDGKKTEAEEPILTAEAEMDAEAEEAGWTAEAEMDAEAEEPELKAEA